VDTSVSIGEIADAMPPKMIQDPQKKLDRQQNTTGWSLGHAPPLQKISSKSVHNFLGYSACTYTHTHNVEVMIRKPQRHKSQWNDTTIKTTI